MKLKKLLKISLFLVILLSVVVNIIVIFHAYNFTHFSTTIKPKTKSPSNLSFIEKLSILTFGVTNPRPINSLTPSQNYETIYLQSNKKIACWLIKQPKSKGTVILFHGYGGNKALLLDKSDIFIALGYNTLLVDFSGSGNSEGNQTTIGFHESLQVRACYEYLQKQGETTIIMFGTSMGAVAIMKAVSEYQILPTKLILECPFGTMLQTVEKRCENMHMPSFPLANLLVFWGGTINNFDAYSHNPIEYANNINISTLLLYGEKDKNVTKTEITTIFSNLKGHKTLKTYQHAGHENYLIKYRNKWIKDISSFL
jgi:alpha-beta hydrolase superfamily lysophospholipase